MHAAFTVSLPLTRSYPPGRPATNRRSTNHPRCATTPPHRISDLPNRDSGHHNSSNPDDDEELPLHLVEGYLDNAKVRPKIDIDADEYMLMWKLRTMLHEDDFNKIFDQSSRRIGEL